MRCDTCGKNVKEVRRVVIYKNYNKTQAVPLYNCPTCYEKKEKTKSYSKK